MSDLPTSSYLEYLPAIFRQNAFLGQFLLAFERILSVAEPNTPLAIEQVIGQIDRFFRPFYQDDWRQTPQRFLPWLAGWVGLSLREDWDDTTRRKFLREIVALYKLRGTKTGLQRMLEIYLGESVPVAIYDSQEDFGFEPPVHFFQVQITIHERDAALLQRKQQIATAIIEQEKPAHTFYALRVSFPTMRLLSEALLAKEGGEPLILGQTTILGTQNAG